MMGFLGMGGVRATSEVGATGASFGAGGSSGDDDDGEWWRGAQQLESEGTPEGEELAIPDGLSTPANMGAADAVARGSRLTGGERYTSQGAAQQLFLEGGRQPADGVQGTATATSSPLPSKTRRGSQERQAQNFGAAAASGGAGDSSLSDEVPVDSMDSSKAWSTAIHAAVASGGFANGGFSNGRSAARPAAEKELGPPTAAAAAFPAVDAGSGTTANRVSTGSTVLDGGHPERGRVGGGNAYGEGGEQQLPRVGSPETVAQSLDTVSLLSEPVAYSKDAKQRVSMLASLWGGGGGGDQAEDTQGNGESEVEGARRLARSLAVKLKERARRCEELEDLFGLRDHQVCKRRGLSGLFACAWSGVAWAEEAVFVSPSKL